MDAVLPLLRRLGAQVREIDGDVDLEDYPRPQGKRAHTVLRLRVDRSRPVHEILSALAEHPSVFSVGEMRRFL